MVYRSTLTLSEQQLRTACEALVFTIGVLRGSNDGNDSDFVNECRQLLTELGCNDNK